VHKLRARNLVLATALLLASVVPAAAQNEVGLSYSILRLYEETAPAGFTVDFSRRLATVGTTAGLTAVGELSVNMFGDIGYENDTTQFTFMGGMRFITGPGKVRPFGQFLIGGLKWTDFETDLAVQPGAGLQVSIRPRLDLRGQIDFPIDFFAGESEVGYRFNVGVVMPLGQ
jgi:hypothetical protein